MNFMKKNRRGFTLIENLMTITVVGTIGGVAATSYIDFREDANRVATQTHLLDIKYAVRGNSNIKDGPAFLSDMGRFPDTLDQLATRGDQKGFSPFVKKGWRGPYVDTKVDWNRDAWGNVLQYNTEEFSIKSCGDDGICGGENAEDDIIVYLNR